MHLWKTTIHKEKGCFLFPPSWSFISSSKLASNIPLTVFSCSKLNSCSLQFSRSFSVISTQKSTSTLFFSSNNKENLPESVNNTNSAISFYQYSEPQPFDVNAAAPAENTNFILSANQSIFEFVRDSTNLPWWATIILVTICLRTAFTLPIAIYQQQRIARIIAIQPVLKLQQEILKRKVLYESRTQKLPYEKYETLLQSEASKHPKTEISCKHLIIERYILPWVQMPLFISMSLTIRGMVDANVIGLRDGGALWFSDLSKTDTTWVFPIAIGLANLFNIEMNARSITKKPTTRQKVMKNIMRGLSLIMIPVASQAPMVGIKLIERLLSGIRNDTTDNVNFLNRLYVYIGLPPAYIALYRIPRFASPSSKNVCVFLRIYANG
ncbi:12544_t:CDS:2 [Ambispora gerdemannii]|uniref:12544_t:CDS:1 n=1 Tax=Ambispora gerdemannii TaxID=144530 RepID=A0A9N8VEL4_9GLOM|nr:12544_t:CDS:2 [Ambispora gerdemannii]